MDEQEEKNQASAFEKQSYSKASSKLDDIQRKSKKAKKIVKFIKAKKLIIPLLIILGVIISIVLWGGFVSLFYNLAINSTNDAKKAAISVSYSDNSNTSTDTGANTDVSTDSTSRIVVKPTKNKDAYEISNNYTDEEIKELRENLENETSRSLDDFSDFEIAIIGALAENGLDIDDWNLSELKCFPAFIKAEACTQYLDLRPNSEKQKGKNAGEYIDKYEPRKDGLDANEVPGVILVQRTNTNGNGKVTLEYKKEADFNKMVEENDKEAINYFTLNDKGNLIIAKWGMEEITVTGEYPENLPESEKEKTTGKVYTITTEKIAYSQYITEYTMPFELLVQLLSMLEDPDFCMELVDQVMGSKIVINIQEEETYTHKVEERTYTVHSKDEKRIDYQIASVVAIEADEDYLLGNFKDDKEEICTNYEVNDKKVTVDRKYTRHSYVFEIIEIDTWIEHYTKSYAAPTTKNEPTVHNVVTNIPDKYTEINTDNKPITDIKETIKDKDVKEFKDEKEKYYKDLITIPEVKIDLGTKYIWDPIIQQYIEIPGDNKISIIPEDRIQSPWTSKEYKQNEVLPSTIDVTTKSNGNLPQITFPFRINNNNYTTSYTKEQIAQCNVTKLDIKEYERIDTVNNITTDVTRYESDPKPIKRVVLYDKVDEKFLQAYDKSETAQHMMRSISSWLFEVMEDDERTEVFVKTIKYLLYKYDGTDYGVTELDLENFFSNSIIMVGSYSSVGNISAFGCTLEREDFINYAKNYKTGDSTYQSKMANYAGDFYDVCTKYGVNPIIAYAHACLETQYGQDIPFNNYFGMAVYNGQASGTKYSSPKESIENYCNWVVNNATIGTTEYASNLNRAQKWSQYNEKLSGNPDTNIYVLYCRYAYLGDKHLCDEPDFSNPKGIEYYKSNGSTWGSGGRIYIYEMYENGGLYTGKYSEMCGHKNADDPTTDQEKADYAVYTTETRVNIAKNIFGEQALSSYGNGEIGQQIINAAERIRQHCTENNYSYNTAVPSYTEGVQALWNKRGVCCASYVAWVLSEVGYEDVVNDCCFRGSTELGKKLKTIFSEVGSYEEMQPGDIIVWPGHHTQIYAGDGYWYNGGSTSKPTVKYSKYDAREVFKNYGYYYILRPQ